LNKRKFQTPLLTNIAKVRKEAFENNPYMTNSYKDLMPRK